MNHRLTFIALLLTLAITTTVRAGGDEPDPSHLTLDPIIVVAQKWEQDPRDVPRSFTVISSGTIQDAGIMSIKEASALVPNLNIVEPSARRLSFPFYRGIGSGQGDPAVATFIDGVPQHTANTASIPLIDAERIEFLRGPQGTLYGRNTLGGAIHIITRPPPTDNQWDVRVQTTQGFNGLQDYQLSIAGPMIPDVLFFRRSHQYNTRDGYTRNDATGNDIDDRESFFSHSRMLWLPSDNVEVSLGVMYERARDGVFPLGDLNALRRRPHHVNHDFEGQTDRDILAPTLTVKLFGDSVDVTSITALSFWDTFDYSDYDFSPADIIRRRVSEEQDYFSQELRLSSADGADVVVGEGATLKWLAGLLLFYADTDRIQINELRPDGVAMGAFPLAGNDDSRGSFQDLGVGVFGQATLSLDDKLDITVGLRFDHEDKDADIDNRFQSAFGDTPTGSSDLDESFTQVVPSFAAAYHWSDEHTTYVSATKGFKAGGFNQKTPVGVDLVYDQETSWTYELGHKAGLFDGTVVISAAVFHIEWNDMQLSLFDPVAGGYIANAGESTSMGAEIEATARVADGVDLFAGFGYTDAEFDKFIDSYAGDVSNNKLTFAPEHTWNVGAQYKRPMFDGIDLLARLEFTGVGRFFYDPGNTQVQRNYILTNLRLGLRARNWHIEGWVRNALDEDYIPVAFQIGPDSFVGESGAPRTFGFTVGVVF